jgi:hypothetical protein
MAGFPLTQGRADRAQGTGLRWRTVTWAMLDTMDSGTVIACLGKRAREGSVTDESRVDLSGVR